jgi:hypothetical protein
VPYGVGRPKIEHFAVFVELDLVISTPLLPAKHWYIQIGKLFMPKDFPDKYQQMDVEEMRDVDLIKIVYLALEKEAPETAKQSVSRGHQGLNF